MENSIATPPACPRCKKSSDIHPLVKEGDRQRFNCQGCSENFWAPALPDVEVETSKSLPGFAFVPIAPPEKTATDGAAPRAKCEKCQKPYFNLGKRYEQHLASCDGKKPHKEKVPRRKYAPLDIPSPTQVYASSVAALLARRAALEAEIRGIDLAVAEINEKMKGAGGPAPAPFVGGRPVNP